MSIRENKIILKNSNVSGNKPLPINLLPGEIAINTEDNKLFSLNTSNNEIFEIGSDKVSKTGDTISGVLISNSFVVNGGTSDEFIKADGSLDSNRYLNNIDSLIIVKTAADLSGPLDSSKTYLIDGVIDMGNTEVIVPPGGLIVKGLDYFNSYLYSNENNYTMFKNENITTHSGNIKFSSLSIYVNGVSSKIFNLDNMNNFSSIEFNSVNIGDFSVNNTDIGEISNYRQFRTNDCAFIKITNGLRFSGTWAGGFRISDTIILSSGLSGSTTSIFDEGTSLQFQGTSISDINALSVELTTSIFNFSESNFLIDEGFIIDNGRFKIGSDPIPNLPSTSTKVFFRGRGITNTYPGGKWLNSNETTTTLTLNNLVKINGTSNYSLLSHFSSSSDNEFTYDSTIEKDFFLDGEIIIDGVPNDELELVVRKWDNENSIYIDVDIIRRRVNNFTGGRDVAFFYPKSTLSLKNNDRVELWIRNVTDNTNIRMLNDSFLLINLRN